MSDALPTTPQATPSRATARDANAQMRFLDRLVLIFPVILLLALCVMIWALQSVSDKPFPHPSVGIFHSGEYATENGLSGQVEVTVEPQPYGNRWNIRLTLVDEHAHPITKATILAHGVEGTRYLDASVIPVADEPGVWEGSLLLLGGATSVMVHADLPGGVGEEWVAEWKPKGATIDVPATP